MSDFFSKEKISVKFSIRTMNVDETMTLGEHIADVLREGDVIILTGNLGVGKTWFTRGLCKRLGISEGVRSPSFSVVNSYERSSGKGIRTVHHADLYRLGPEDELVEWGILDLVGQGNSVLIVEWGEPLVSYLGDHYLLIEISRLKGYETGRIFKFFCFGWAPERCNLLYEKGSKEFPTNEEEKVIL